MKSDFRLLYVEDNEMVRDNFVEIFSRYFSSITTACDGKTALELYEKDRFDLAILDISIPKINGLNVAENIRDVDSTIEIIMLTAYSDKERLLQAVNLQLFSYLIKPVKQNELDTTMKKVISKLYEASKTRLRHGYNWNNDSDILSYKEDEIKISKNEKKLIKFLYTNSSKYYSACEIANELFHTNNKNDIKCNNIVQLISRFKKKMLDLYHNEYFFIDNVYGLGYKITS